MSTEINNYVLESIPKIVSFIIYLFIIPSIYADILGKGSTVRSDRSNWYGDIMRLPKSMWMGYFSVEQILSCDKYLIHMLSEPFHGLPRSRWIRFFSGLMKILDAISAYDRVRFNFLMRVLSCIEHLNLDWSSVGNLVNE